MANIASTEQAIVLPIQSETNLARIENSESSARPAGSPYAWNSTTIGALLILVALWAAKLYTTWAAWGNLTIDSGHEMYVPALLAEGKQLYRDTWFVFGPAGPYFNSYLFRQFGEKLNVLYWAGSLSALGSAIFLYLTGMKLSSWLIGWTAGAAVLLEGFQPSLFCFPLPYSFSAVYGCMVGCLFLWLVVCAETETEAAPKRWIWIFGAGISAAVALLLKPEFGLASYGTLSLLMAVRGFRHRSWGVVAKDLLAVLPGVLICAAVILWMVSIAGVEFITQENIQSWPTSYFMKTYAKNWLAHSGFMITPEGLKDAALRTIPLAATVLVAICLFWWKRTDRRAMLLKGTLLLILALYLGVNAYGDGSFSQKIISILSNVFFPQDMVLYVVIAAVVAWASFCFFGYSRANHSSAIPLLFTFTGLIAFRVLMNMAPFGYAIYYNGPAVLSFLLLLAMIFPRSGRSRRFIFLSELLICFGCLTPIFLQARMAESDARDYVPLKTERGTVRVSKHLAENYSAAIQFMKEKAALGQYVLSIPEDTSLYFLSGTYCPTRVYLFIPGSLAPGKMTVEMIGEVDHKPVQYLLWSNRTFSEYGAPIFGRDFDREVGDYLKSHFHRIGPLIPNTGTYRDWTAVVWERLPDTQPQ